MKAKFFKVMSLLFLIVICSSAFKTAEVGPPQDVYMWLFYDGNEVTDGTLQSSGAATWWVEVITSNGDWCIEYATSNCSEHITLDRQCDSSDATRHISVDGTPGTYVLDFWLEGVKMTSLTILVE